MITHPLLLALLALDALSLLFLLYAARVQLRVLLGWEPGSSSARQVALENAVDGAALATRWGVSFFFAATLLWVVAVSAVLPGLVRGAMCGTGVLEAMRGLGERTLALRGLTLLVLWVWRTLDGLQRSVPRAPGVPTAARWQLLAIPLVLLAVVYGVRALWQLDPEQPVSCCTVVYTALGPAAAAKARGFGVSAWLTTSALLTLLLASLALARRWRWAGSSSLALSTLVAAVAAIWLPVSTFVLIRWLAAYHYQVLHHICPFCLFLPEHYAVGYPLYGALLLVALESLAALAAARFAAAYPSVQQAALRRERRALALVLGGLVVFLLLAAGPALLWRWQHGVWITG